MQTLIQDLRFSVRQLIKNPGFTVTAVISLALGIGATTAVFSVIYAALLDPYPFRAADRIVRMSVRTKAGSVETVNLNVPQIQQLRQVRAIESMLAMDYHAMTRSGAEPSSDRWKCFSPCYTRSAGFGSKGLAAARGAEFRASLLCKSANIRSRSKSNWAA